MTHLEFLPLFGSFTIVGQENVSNPQTQQIRETLAVMRGRQYGWTLKSKIEILNKI